MSDFSCTAAPTGQVFKAVPMIVATSSVKGRAPSPYSLRARARVQSFYVLAFTSSPFWCKVLIDCALRVKVSPFCLHRFFATDVVQRVVFQIVAVKVNAGSAFTLNRLIYSFLRGNVKGEGKNGKFGECACAYIRVGACPARRIEWDFVRGREVLRETREEVAKSGDVWRESRLVFFERSGGGGRKTPAFLFSSPAKVEIGTNSKQKHPVKLIFSAKTEISGENFSRTEEKNTPQKVVFAPKAAEMGKKTAVLGWKSQGGGEAKKRT